MPAYLETPTTSDTILTTDKWLSGKTSKSARGQQSSRCITIGLVNNMPDGALESTERQFTSLLDAASGSTNVRLFLYSMTDICRRGRAASRVRTLYSGVESLWDTPLDGIIVTGREPLAANLVDEPYWASFETLVEWAREHTHSAVWSCLAAHAAVLHCDGINRIKSPTKRCGIFDCSRSEDHFLT
ncbi:MAG: homoserine O-acetyltransferase/O-succinyltransferase family protein, partial [Acidobacteriaceae bacterium]